MNIRGDINANSQRKTNHKSCHPHYLSFILFSIYLLVAEVEDLQGHMVIHQGDLNDLEGEPQALAHNKHDHDGCQDKAALLTLPP